MIVCLELHLDASVMSGENIACINEEAGLLVGKFGDTAAGHTAHKRGGTGGSTGRLHASRAGNFLSPRKKECSSETNTQTPMGPQTRMT